MRYHPEKVPSVIERYQKEMLRVLGVLESVLSKQPWLVGDKMTVADLSFVPYVFHVVLMKYSMHKLMMAIRCISNQLQQVCSRRVNFFLVFCCPKAHLLDIRWLAILPSDASVVPFDFAKDFPAVHAYVRRSLFTALALLCVELSFYPCSQMARTPARSARREERASLQGRVRQGAPSVDRRVSPLAKYVSFDVVEIHGNRYS
jgi:hypothetical protein